MFSKMNKKQNKVEFRRSELSETVELGVFGASKELLQQSKRGG